ncbi:MAG: ADP-ribosylation/crystallin J1 [Tenacibaculum sp.]|nr:ADP-ribosylation/crystallin J1 [Tenacibaculum sp.]
MKTLYRPVREKEMLLIAESGFKSFPPRLEQQPIFYPVLNEEYASEIAEKWNTTDPFGNFLGFVTKFSITKEEFRKYQIENVGGNIHNELWVPSEDLDIFNSAIVGNIEVVKVYIGNEYQSSDSTIIEDLVGEIERIEK